MIGILFHGPEVFDSGWAARLIKAAGGRSRQRLMLAGAMSRTALFDSGLVGVETPGLQPSQCVKLLEKDCAAVLLATCSKSVKSGLVFGSLVAGRAAAALPLVQAECSGPVYAVHSGACPARLSSALEKLGFSMVGAIEARIELWNEGGALCRRMTTAEKGDLVLVNGIVVGRAEGKEVVLLARGRTIREIRGVSVKLHGLEKLERLGGVDLASAKLASTRRLRRTGAAARAVKTAGKGVVFIDHAGMQVYALAERTAGVVTVGDDTTAVAGDILRRFCIPVIGITDGDGDALLGEGKLYKGSTVFTVASDDTTGLLVRRKIFSGKERSDLSFPEVKKAVELLIADRVLSRKDI